MHDFKEKAVMTTSRGKKVTVSYIVLEKISRGELFNYVKGLGAFSEKVCKYFFKQMLMGVHSIH